jgi:hypothetical protein
VASLPVDPKSLQRGTAFVPGDKPPLVDLTQSKVRVPPPPTRTRYVWIIHFTTYHTKVYGFFLSRHLGIEIIADLDQGLRIKQNDKYDAPPGAITLEVSRTRSRRIWCWMNIY